MNGDVRSLDRDAIGLVELDSPSESRSMRKSALAGISQLAQVPITINDAKEASGWTRT